jgi:DNA-binding NarL/FixJ family response regulator
MNEQSEAARLARHTILLIDDDARIRQTLTLLLNWAGDWEVVGEAADARLALDLAAARQPELVLLDRWLDDGDALGLIPRLRALARPPLIVMLSGDGDVAIRRQAIALGAAAWLEKTTPPLDLLQMLRAFFP